MHESDGSEEDEGEGSVSDTWEAPGDLGDLETFTTNLDPSAKRKFTGEPDHDAH